MDFSTVCRTCLCQDELNPIFQDSDEEKKFSNAIFVTTGIKVDPSDGLPQNMCAQCITFLNKSLAFRKKCLEVEKKLLKIKNKIQISSSESTTNELDVIEVNEVAYEQEKAKIFVKIEPLTKSEQKIEDLSQIKMEYTNYEVLEDINDDLEGLYYTETDDVEIKKELFSLNEVPNNTALDEDPPYLTKPDDTKFKTKRVTCKLCQKELSIRSVDSHMAKSHPGADLRKVKCEYCDSYLRKEKLRRHIKMAHGSGDSLRCGHCKSEFDCKDTLLQHTTACTAKRKIRICKSSRNLMECDICHKTMQKGSLRLHKAVKHAGLGPVCEHCGRRFSNKLRLTEHYRAKHGYDKFKCDLCDFESSSDVAMQNHARRHRGEKPFVCADCGAAFHAAYLLVQHKRSHNTERSVQCSLCPAKFKANNSLHTHKMACHSGVSYKCNFCAKTYSSRQYTVKHIRHTHKYSGHIPALQRVHAEPTEIIENVDNK